MPKEKTSPLEKIPGFNKIDNPYLESISGLDATFLYGETDTSPMHIGGVMVIEGSLEFETFKKIIHSRIHQMPKLRKRLVYVPLSIDYPYWVDDPNFDIDLHIHHTALPSPGNWKHLRSAASRIFSQPLDQSRPLWSLTFVEGLDNVSQVPKGSVAVISKIHHVAVDGLGGAGLLSLIFDVDDKVREIPEPKPFHPVPIPNELQIMLNSAASFAKDPFKLPKILGSTLSATIKTGFLNRAHKLDLPTAPFSAPKTPLNGIISARRKWNTAILSLARVKELKNIMECTLNDVVLGICAGALRRYLLEKDQLPIKPLVSMIPISIRKKDSGKAGNQLSNMLIQLATNVEDPIERLETIQENTIRGKTYQNAIGAKTLSNIAEAIPFGLANQAARLYSRFHLAEIHNPVFNVTITNVPGPPIPLYVNGHKVLSVMGSAPIIDGMGLIIAVLSYDGLLTISPTSDAKSMPDLDVFTRYIRESANELEAAILKKGKPQKEKTVAKKTVAKSKSAVFFNHVKKHLKANAEHIKPNNGLFLFEVKGPVPTRWRVDLNKSPGVVRKGTVAKPDVTLTISDDHLMRIATGKLNLQTAFIQGRVKIKGDTAKAMKLASIFNKIPKLK